VKFNANKTFQEKLKHRARVKWYHCLGDNVLNFQNRNFFSCRKIGFIFSGRNEFLSENFDVGSPRLDVAHVDAALDIKVAGETPSGTPGVADNPVRSGGDGGCGRGGTVSDDDNGVIDVVLVSENASGIAVDSRSTTSEN